ncbi:30S ribosomal protein S4e [Halorubrum sp. 48-1-W]|uniref:30S ribosomal protein S4e n=1 Tax=Halorubrum sp. 48-1-W TaxID=2249761 RepID=UPI000DCDED68|nr:30S ribosomal protein S4e [Halorubrum sp. 48-1-W]RAW47036.1 30S ribosomal protein S4e [Halorubrum sp. 48-1-W]
MTRHQKRLAVPNSWPVERKTQTFTVKAGAGPHGEAGVPLVVLLRDVLGYVDSTKEARYALNNDSVLVNGDAVSDEQRPIGMFDILAFPVRGEFFRVFPDEGGRLALTPVDEESAGSRLGKVTNKTVVPGGDVQLTLHDGTNVRVDAGTEYDTKDSVVVDNESKEVVAHFEYEEGALVTAIAGQHAGRIGEIETIDVTLGSGSNTVVVGDGEDRYETVEEYVVVIDENFTDDDADESDADDAADDVDEATGDDADDVDDAADDVDEATGDDADEAGETDE